jgi:hypothetical protein
MAFEKLSSVWIGYGCIVDTSFWTNDFEQWFRSPVPIVSDESGSVLMVPLATTTKTHAEQLGIVELPADTAFSLDYEGLTRYVAEDAVGQVVHDWSVFRDSAAVAGFVIGEGRWLFAHLID